MSSAQLERTKTPGIYRRGSRYVVVFRDPTGRQRKRFARTLAEARDLKLMLGADVARGEYRTLSKITFAEYAAGPIDTYQGLDLSMRDRRVDPGRLSQAARAGRGFVLRPDAPLLAAIEPRHLKEYVRHLGAPRTAAELENGRRRWTIAPSTVRLGVAPVRALLATAVEEGLIRSNPAAVRIAGQRGDVRRERRERDGREGALRPSALPACSRSSTTSGASSSSSWTDRPSDRGGDRASLGRRRPRRRTIQVRRRFYRGRVGPPKSKYGRRIYPDGLVNGAGALAASEGDSRRRRRARLHG